MKVLHVCAGWQPWNGAANIARMVMDEQRRAGHDVSHATWASPRALLAADEVWIHCGWLPCLWWAALWGRRVRWMPEACYDPVRLAYHGWKKRLAGPFERFFLRRAERIVATCGAEADWIRAYLGRRCPQVEVTDVKRFFRLGRVERAGGDDDRVERAGGNDDRVERAGGDDDRAEHGVEAKGPLHLLYLGRRHPLKGLEYLESAVCDGVELRVVSSAFGEEKERVWDWCDVLVLPTLSDNFGLVVAEALERGKRVVTTDGAPAWGDGEDYGGRLVYLRGYRDGTAARRVALLGDAVRRLAAGPGLAGGRA